MAWVSAYRLGADVYSTLAVRVSGATPRYLGHTSGWCQPRRQIKFLVANSGACEPGTTCGCASDETQDHLLSVRLMATRLGRKLTDMRKSSLPRRLRPDSRTQVRIGRLR